VSHPYINIDDDLNIYCIIKLPMSLGSKINVFESIWWGCCCVMKKCIYSKVHRHLSDSPKSNKDQNEDLKKLINFQQKIY
jgi:hypothetical protein